MNPNRYMVVGFQASGKTTFAAALWHLVDSREISTALVKGKHVGDFRYLEEIAKSWAEGWQVERTKTQQVEEISINLRYPATETDLSLEFADLSGETFEKAFATRLVPPTVVELVKQSSGILLFVSADRLVDGATILDAFGSDKSDGNSVQDDDSDESPFNPEKTPLQVQLVDLLQALSCAPLDRQLLRVAVIVSAWDLADEKSAEIWLAKRLPLLDQFLRNSESISDRRIYGVSAQGGQLPKKGEKPTEERERLLSVVPSKRIKIVGTDVSEHDLTGPLLWLSGLAQKA